MDALVEMEGVGMRFVRREHRRGWQALRHALQGRRDHLWALRDVTLRVGRGEVVGIQGPNGAGKSTLLRLIAATLRPTEGTVRVRGRVAPLLALDTGFEPKLSGLENIYLNASLFGLSREQIRRRVDDIVAFAGLEDSIRMPVGNFSTGMRSRLGFAISSHLDADVLLLDEVLAVGDREFQAQCRQRVQEWVEGDHTVIMVQHDEHTLPRYCSRLVELDRGRVVSDEVARRAGQEKAVS